MRKEEKRKREKKGAESVCAARDIGVEEKIMPKERVKRLA
jgi:hypothetical protein